jgi:hypothetical protein
MTGFHECVEACFAYFPREQADKICDPGCKEAYQCHTVSGDKCPSGLLASSGKILNRSPFLLPFLFLTASIIDFFPQTLKNLLSHITTSFLAAKGDAVGEKCVSGCRSSVCNKMVTGKDENKSCRVWLLL